jgi:hypothetical protein
LTDYINGIPKECRPQNYTAILRGDKAALVKAAASTLESCGWHFTIVHVMKVRVSIAKDWKEALDSVSDYVTMKNVLD